MAMRAGQAFETSPAKEKRGGHLVSLRTPRFGQWLGFAKNALVFCGTIVAAIAVWWAVAKWLLNPILFASPSATWTSFRESLRSGVFWINTKASLERILIGYVIGAAVGVPLGLFMGSFKPVRKLLGPYVGFLRFVPPIALLPLAILWFGIGEPSKYFLIAFSSAFIILLNTMAGVFSVPKVRAWAGQSLGLGTTNIFVRVTLPSTVPFIVTGMRIAMGNAFMTIVAAEMISANSGLGYMIFQARQFLQTGTMFVGLIAIGLFGFLSDLLLAAASRVLFRRFGLHEAD